MPFAHALSVLVPIGHLNLSLCSVINTVSFYKVISNQIDTSKDPCDDFYAYACGGFIKTHQLKGNQSSVGGFTIVNDDNMKVLQQAMVNASTKYNQVRHTVSSFN